MAVEFKLTHGPCDGVTLRSNRPDNGECFVVERWWRDTGYATTGAEIAIEDDKEPLSHHLYRVIGKRFFGHECVVECDYVRTVKLE